MGFFLLRRDGDAVTLIAPTVFDSRHEALGEVSRATAEGSLDADEVFVVDLDAATPVLIVAPPPLAVEPEVPEAQVEPVEAPIAAAVLADANAASPPEPVSEEPLEPPVEQSDSPETPQPEPAAETVARTWPWEPVPAPVDTPLELVDQPGEEDEAADEEEADELPAEVSGLLADLEELAPAPPAEYSGEAETDDVDEAEVSEPHAVEESVETGEATAEPEPEPEGPPGSDDVDAGFEEESEPAKAYEAGASDITTMTCDDCIYLNTCPKKGESDPTSCGSFQWKSV